MNWVVLTFLAVLARAVYGLSTKVLSSSIKVSSKTQSFLFLAFSLALSLGISPFIGGISFHGLSDHRWFVGIIVISLAFGSVVYYKGMEKLDVSTSQVAFSSILIWGVIFSWIFLGSKFSLTQIFGIAVLLLAILLVQYRKGLNMFNHGILYIVASAGLFAIFQVSSAGLSNSVSPGTYLVVANLGATIIVSTIYAPTIKKELPLLRNKISATTKPLLFASTTNLAYFTFAYFAYKTAPDSGIVVILLTSQVILAVILGIILLKERDKIARKILAGVLAVIAGILIKS